mgnify:CR=1 FL=1
MEAVQDGPDEGAEEGIGQQDQREPGRYGHGGGGTLGREEEEGGQSALEEAVATLRTPPQDQQSREPGGPQPGH